MPHTTSTGNTTGNTVLDLLSEARIDPGEVSDAFASVLAATGTFTAREFGVGKIPLEVAEQRATEAIFSVAAVAANLGERVGELRLELVRSSPERKRRIVAAHEAAHAAACFACGIPVALCSIDPDDLSPAHDGMTRTSGQVEFLLNYSSSDRLDEDTRRQLEPMARRVAAVCLAGPLGEAVVACKDRFPEFGSDLQDARRVCCLCAPPNTEHEMLRRSFHAAEVLVRATKTGVEALSHALDARSRLDGAEVEDILREHLRSPLLAALTDGLFRPA